MRQEIIRIDQGIIRNPQWRMASPIDLTICEGEQIAIVGNNAAGKSRLVEVLTQHYPLMPLHEAKYDFTPSPLRLVSENLKYISFRDSYGESDGTYYYQQRWNQHDIDENTPTVGALLQQAYEQARASMGYKLEEKEMEILHERQDKLRNHLNSIFGLDAMREKYIISLSSGELRKFQLARTLLSVPRALILDNPFIGLDIEARTLLRNLLQTLAEEMQLLIILVLGRTEDIPDFITHIIPVEGLTVLPKTEKDAYLAAHGQEKTHGLEAEYRKWMLELPEKDLEKETFYPGEGGEILRFDDVSIRYGSHTILDRLSWSVNEGERWALSGPNGSGKSTLLSLVCADNPQGYACPISLFGHKRGTGESIWQIKHHIGYVSPEMHRAYLKDLPAIDIVASGLSDSVGLYFRPSAQQRQICQQWMEIFGIKDIADRTFLKLSSGEQRLCLLARAFVKDPELLILDEPLHGLDSENRQRVKDIIETFCQRRHKTLIMVTHYKEELPNCITHRLELKRNK